MDSAALIANPIAGSCRSRLSAEMAAELLRGQDFQVEVLITSGPGDATALAARAAERHPVVAAAGGDGTAHEVATGVMGTAAALAVLPCGSGNDFARGLGIPSALAGAVAAGARRPRPIDVAYLDGQPFFNSAGFFLSGRVSGLATRFPRAWGRLRYRAAALWAMLSYRPPRSRWSLLADQPARQERWLLVEIGNGPSAGGGFRLTPDARLGDGLLDFCLVRPLPLVTLFRLFPAAARGERLEHPGVHRLQAAAANLDFSGPAPIHLDGEPASLSSGRHRVSIVPGQLNVLAPPGTKLGLATRREDG